MKYIIEHLEPEVYEWCVMEYRHISQIVGKQNLIFTNVKKDQHKLKAYGEVKKESVKEMKLEKPCILDPYAEKTLKPEDKKFSHMIFGGILGDNPPKKRTEIELSSQMKSEKRNLGREQMPTDNAVYVVKKIVEDGKKLEELTFKDTIELDVAEGESVILPFRYAIEDGKIIMPEDFIEFLRNREEF